MPLPTVLSAALSFLSPLLVAEASRPFVLAISGPQGSGKSTLASELCTALSPLTTAVLSIDDLYLPYSILSARNQPRGLPGTHDISLGLSVLQKLKARSGNVTLPRYNKSAYSGRGDRHPIGKWEYVDATKLDVLIFEGWCVGFSALGKEGVEKAWNEGRGMGYGSLERALEVDKALERYREMMVSADALVHIDAQDIGFVYGWRLEQEIALRERVGKGMTDTQVKEFVDGYMPGYEMYAQGLREGLFRGTGKKQLRVIVGKNRETEGITEIV